MTSSELVARAHELAAAPLGGMDMDEARSLLPALATAAEELEGMYADGVEMYNSVAALNVRLEQALRTHHRDDEYDSLGVGGKYFCATCGMYEGYGHVQNCKWVADAALLAEIESVETTGQQLRRRQAERAETENT